MKLETTIGAAILLAASGAKAQIYQCSPCPAGTYAAAGAASCTPCATGTYSAAGAASCTPCATGTYQPSTGQTSCLPCAGTVYSSRAACCASAANYWNGSTCVALIACGSNATRQSNNTCNCNSGYSGNNTGATINVGTQSCIQPQCYEDEYKTSDEYIDGQCDDSCAPLYGSVAAGYNIQRFEIHSGDSQGCYYLDIEGISYKIDECRSQGWPESCKPSMSNGRTTNGIGYYNKRYL